MELDKEKYLSVKILSPGIAVGKVYLIHENIKTITQSKVDDAEKEINRFRRLVNRIADDLLKMYESISTEIDPSEAKIVETQRMFVLDEGFQKNVLNLIAAEFLSAENAAQKVLNDIAGKLTNAKSNYFKQRADDLFDLAKYFQSKAFEDTRQPFDKFKEDIIIFISELFPSTVLSCRNTRVKGIVVEQGAPASHAAILAKSFGIPALARFADLTDNIHKNQVVILDGFEGKIIAEPDAETISTYEQKLRDLQVISNRKKSIESQPAVTADGTPIGIFVNIERLEELDILPLNNIERIGLFRTESLFMYEQPDFPPMSQQIEWYRKTINFMSGKPVTIRILDIGGDKFLPYFAMGRQDNPYLGLRGNRVFQYHPELLETQLQAILKAANGGKVRILYPMVNTLEDIEFFKNVFSKFKEEYDLDLEIGIMIETPASVFLIRELIREVDFVSIGTNDLVQYTLTVDRNNENVIQHYKPTMLVIIKMMEKVIQTANEFNKAVSVCGEIASDPIWIPLLIGLGIQELSIAPNTLYSIKNKILSLNLNECNKLASQVLEKRYEREVENLLKSFIEDIRN
ncbi:MAG: phosphoenolpyruvate--protein phosphotransferase [Promethearchaeota archaeon]|jgi:phosphotransferase system enzyme I (PtsI)